MMQFSFGASVSFPDPIVSLSQLAFAFAFDYLQTCYQLFDP